ncbi:MAG: DHH family phosphoesterase [Desulfurococcales archaeon]|nr:DHH family phosphoesterase [Desulfurococcales archaeon]
MTHRNADPDAIASAYLIAHALSILGLKTTIYIPEGPSRLSKRIIDRLGLDKGLIMGYDKPSHRTSPDMAVAVDSANPAQLGPFSELFEEATYKVVIDHHEGNTLKDKAVVSLVYKDAPSTTEIVVNVLEALGINPMNKMATLGITGILYDTKRFINARESTFKAILRLIEWGGDYREAIGLLTMSNEKEGLSERIARLKALSRLVLGRSCNDVLVAVTRIGSHESMVARTLIDLGADVAVVVTSRGLEKRVSIRVSKSALEKGITASLIAEYLAKKYNGEGGGHDAVAMTHLKYSGDIEDLKESIAKSLPGKIARICLSKRG